MTEPHSGWFRNRRPVLLITKRDVRRLSLFRAPRNSTFWAPPYPDTGNDQARTEIRGHSLPVEDGARNIRENKQSCSTCGECTCCVHLRYNSVAESLAKGEPKSDVFSILGGLKEGVIKSAVTQSRAAGLTDRVRFTAETQSLEERAPFCGSVSPRKVSESVG